MSAATGSWIILSGGPLPKPLTRLTGAQSRFSLPLGRQSALEVKIQEGLSCPDKPTVTVVYDSLSGHPPQWLVSKYPFISLLRFPGVSPGAGASLDFALGKLNTKGPCVVSYGDSIFDGLPTGAKFGQDFMCVGEPLTSQNWATAQRDLQSGELAIEPLSPSGTNLSDRMPVVAGLFGFANGPRLAECVADAVSTSDFLRAVCSYDRRSPSKIDIILTDAWLDIGHTDEFLMARESNLKAREFNRLRAKEGWVQKSSKESEKIQSEIRWYRSLPHHLRKFVPDFREVGPDRYQTRFVSAPTLGEKVSFGTMSKTGFRFAAESLESWIKESEVPKPGTLAAEAHFDFIQEKLAHRYRSLVELLKERGIRFISTGAMEADLSTLSPPKLPKSILKAMTDHHWGFLHGDLYFGNCLSDEHSGFFKLIDPRGDFGGLGTEGPQIYEWSKIAQSIFWGFDRIERGHFSGFQFGNRYVFSADWQIPSKNTYDSRMKSWFLDACPYPEDALILSSALILGSAPLHKDEGDIPIALAITGLEGLHQLTGVGKCL